MKSPGSYLPYLLQRLAVKIESVTPRYSGRGETALALASIPLAFIYKLLDLLYGKNAPPGQPWPYILLLCLFTAVAFSSVFWLATPLGERRIRSLMTARGRFWLAALPPLYLGAFLFLLWLLGLPELSSHALSSVSLPWVGAPIPLFILSAGGLLFAGCWAGLTQAAKAKPIGPDGRHGFGLVDLGCVLLAAIPFLVLQEQLPLLWCFSTPVVVTVMVYATGLGREYFNYSFVPRTAKPGLFVSALLLTGLLLFFAANDILGAASYTGNLWRSPWYQIYEILFVHLFIVGVSEEIIFRMALFSLIAAQITVRLPGRFYRNRPRAAALLLISILFGLAHFPHGLLLVLLASAASLLYGLAFVAGQSLFGPVLLHGLLNILIMMNYRISVFQ